MNFLLLDEIVSLLKVLGDETRLKILKSLQQESKNVSRLKKEIGKSQSTVSQQLKILQDVDLIESEKIGRKKRFQLTDEEVFEILAKIENFIYVQNKKLMEKFTKQKIFNTLS